MKIFTPFLLVTLLVVLGCSSQEKLAKYKDVEISFGNGGGFTGQEITYTISNDGKLKMTDKLNDETNEIATIKAGKTLKLFEQLEGLNLNEIDFDHPGNMYYFIQQTETKSKEKVVWGDANNKPPQAILDYYHLLNSIVNK